ncbi:MAG: hypothetical protein RL274_2421 [Pseudomonadota bacterium]|jgi:TPR repeat protein
MTEEGKAANNDAMADWETPASLLRDKTLLLSGLDLLMTKNKFDDLELEDWETNDEEALSLWFEDQTDVSQEKNALQLWLKDTTEDKSALILWIRPKVLRGIARGQRILAEWYYNGRCVPADFSVSAKWLHKAAQQGDPEAQMSLGMTFGLGHGVPQDFVQAHIWFNLAASQSFDNAGQERDDLAHRMTSEQVAEAQRRASEWKPIT